MKIERIDHLNLTVADIDRSVEFYQRVLGMKTESMGEGRAALYFGQQKIHLDAAGGATQASGWLAMFSLLAAGILLGPIALWWSQENN